MSDNLSFLDDGQSIASTVTNLHHYFRTTYSRYKIKRGDLVSRLEAADPDTIAAVQEEIRQIDEALALFGILSDSLSVANRVLHTETVAKTLGIETQLYDVHLETEDEQLLERSAAQRRVENQS